MMGMYNFLQIPCNFHISKQYFYYHSLGN